MEPLQHTARLPGGSKPWNSHHMPLHCPTAVGRGSPGTGAGLPLSRDPCRHDKLLLTIQCIALFARRVFVLGVVCLM